MARQKAIDLLKYKEQDIFSVNEYLQLVQDYRPHILDIRSKKEYCQGHLCGAFNVVTPLPPLYQADILRLEKTLDNICTSGPLSPIIVYCKLGKRAGLAKRILKDLGYTNVLSLGGVDDKPLKSIMNGSDPRIPICQCAQQ